MSRLVRCLEREWTKFYNAQSDWWKKRINDYSEWQAMFESGFNAGFGCLNDFTYCPQCGETLVHTNIGDGTMDTYCEECGFPDEDFDEGDPDYKTGHEAGGFAEVSEDDIKNSTMSFGGNDEK